MKSERVMPLPDTFEVIKSEENSNILDENIWTQAEKNESETDNFECTEEMKTEIEYIFHQAFIALVIHFLHTFLGPISIPFLWLVCGKNLCTNMGFNWHQFYIYELIPWTWIPLTILYYFLSYTEFSNSSSIILATSSAIFIKELLISIKYGYYTEEFWNYMKSEKIPAKMLVDQLIVSSWQIIPPDIARQELLKSFKRLNRDPSQLCMAFKSELPEKIKEMIEKTKDLYNIKNSRVKVLHHRKSKDCVPSIIFSKILIDLAVKFSMSKLESRILDVFALSFALAPIISFVINYGWDFGALGVIYWLYSFLICIVIARRYLLYVYVGIVDMKRRKFLMKRCSSLISIKERDKSLPEEYWYPSLDFYDLKSIDSWYNMRAAFLDFGRQYTYRTVIYASSILPICILIIFSLILEMFEIISIISIPATIAVIYLAFISLIGIAYMTIIGSQINDMFDVHRDLITTLSNDVLHISKNSQSNNNAIYQSLCSIDSKLQHDEILRPIKIMGLKANSKFIANLGALIVSGLASLWQIGYARGTNL
ncbi:unnamed protein product [Blepharisma stoltei]|uniref:Odorant receptor n=1 Tax=Blepharisma stoltei TaxID=1481888 RepID=A0AAU9JHZ4_9CILI|nr:unnamed protein product [Blepharisma stoltei]